MVKRKSKTIFFTLFLVTLLLAIGANITKSSWLDFEANASPVPSWPPEVAQIEYVSAAGRKPEPALFYKPDVRQPVPLLVALHTWDGDYRQPQSAPYAEWCIEHDWAFIHPNFQGRNDHPKATGSDKVMQDVLSAVEYAKNNSNIDPNRIYLAGVSGGGYTALLVAARHPDIWAAVSVWAPITDLSAWYFESKKYHPQYADDIVKSLMGAPGSSAKVDLEYKNRSPITYLSGALPFQLDINAGITDHTALVSHSLLAFNALAAPKDRLSEEDVKYFVERAQTPPHLKDPLLFDASYGEKAPLFRRLSGNTRLTIFNGRHEIIFAAALMWLEQQRK